MILGGVVLGLDQLIRGVIATPFAVSNSCSDKEWSTDDHTWIKSDLKDEAERILSVNEPDLTGSGGMKKEAKDTEFYDVLGFYFFVYYFFEITYGSILDIFFPSMFSYCRSEVERYSFRD